jgi:hypothetical protein
MEIEREKTIKDNPSSKVDFRGGIFTEKKLFQLNHLLHKNIPPLCFFPPAQSL